MEAVLKGIKKPKILKLGDEHFFISPLGKGPIPEMGMIPPITVEAKLPKKAKALTH